MDLKNQNSSFFFQMSTGVFPSCVCVYVTYPVPAEARRPGVGGSHWAHMRELRTEPGSSRRTAGSQNHWATSPRISMVSPRIKYFKMFLQTKRLWQEDEQVQGQPEDMNSCSHHQPLQKRRESVTRKLSRRLIELLGKRMDSIFFTCCFCRGTGLVPSTQVETHDLLSLMDTRHICSIHAVKILTHIK